MIIKFLIINKKEIVKNIYIHLLKNVEYKNDIPKLLEFGINRFENMLRWIFLSSFIVFLSYIILKFKILLNFLYGCFFYLQIFCHWFLVSLMNITGFLSIETLNNLWLIFILLIGLLIVYLFFLFFKYLKNKYLRYKINKEELKKVLLEECQILDKEHKNKYLIEKFNNKI